jgi:hypothetical protein
MRYFEHPTPALLELVEGDIRYLRGNPTVFRTVADTAQGVQDPERWAWTIPFGPRP